jgi:hypothetical protein
LAYDRQEMLFVQRVEALNRPDDEKPTITLGFAVTHCSSC